MQLLQAKKDLKIAIETKTEAKLMDKIEEQIDLMLQDEGCFEDNNI